MTRDEPKRSRGADLQLLFALGETARSERERDGYATLEALAAGELDAAAVALPAAAAGEAERELFAPWDDAAQDALVERALEHLTLDAPAQPLAAVPSLHQARVRSRARYSRFAALSGAVALAAATVLMLRPTPSRLPEYTASVQAGDHSQRSMSDAAATPSHRRTVHERSLLELQLRPEAPALERVWAALLVREPGTKRLRLVALRPELADSGAVRWRASASELTAGRLGEVDVIAIVGAGREPAAPEILRRAAAAAGSDLYSFELPLLVLAE